MLDTILKYYISDLILSTERNRYFIAYLEKYANEINELNFKISENYRDKIEELNFIEY